MRIPFKLPNTFRSCSLELKLFPLVGDNHRLLLMLRQGLRKLLLLVLVLRVKLYRLADSRMPEGVQALEKYV